MSISNKTIEILKKSGWYKGREIDITENIEFLTKKGFIVFNSAKNFMKEFGELQINVEKIRKDGSKKISKHSTCIKEAIGVLSALNFGLDEYVKEQVIPIGSLYNLGVNLYISESGRIFDSTGWLGDNVWEAFDNIINEKGKIIWDKFEV